MSQPAVYIKDPDARLDYGLRWAAWLDGDIITGSSWLTDDPALVVDANSHTSTETYVWLSGGGPVGTKHAVTNRIETAAGRIEDSTIYIVIREK